jgi:hypothetical protein
MLEESQVKVADMDSLKYRDYFVVISFYLDWSTRASNLPVTFQLGHEYNSFYYALVISTEQSAQRIW